MAGIDAMLGLGFGENDEEYTRALAGNLRGDVGMGDAMALSTIPQMADLGRRTSRRAMVQAQSGGNRRESLKKAILAEKNRKEQEQYDRSKFDRVFTQKASAPGGDAGGTTGKQWFKTKDAAGNAVMFNPTTGESRYPSKAGEYDLEGRTKTAAEAAADKKFSQNLGKTREEHLADVRTNIAGSEQARNAYKEVLSTLQGGAWTGPIDVRTPTFRPMSAALESAGSKLTLDLLTKYKLTPVSDKDIAVLRQAALPENMEQEQLTTWVEHKIEALDRAARAEQLMADYLENSSGRAPQGEDRKALRAQMDQILYSDGFDPFDPFDPGQPKTPAAPAYNPEDSATWTKPDDVTVEEWAAFSDEDKMMLMGN